MVILDYNVFDIIDSKRKVEIDSINKRIYRNKSRLKNICDKILKYIELNEKKQKDIYINNVLKEKLKLETMIEIDEIILETLKEDYCTIEYLKSLKTNKEKIKYLRYVKRLTQEEVALIIDLSTRQVQRIEKQIREENGKGE